jgi:hypothetical protein
MVTGRGSCQICILIESKNISLTVMGAHFHGIRIFLIQEIQAHRSLIPGPGLCDNILHKNYNNGTSIQRRANQCLKQSQMK